MYKNNDDNYDVMQVCLNGHIITDYYYLKTHLRKEYCPKCGAKTIPSNVSIPSLITVPKMCEHCGKPFPWTKEKEEVAKNGEKQNFGNIDFINKICEKFPIVVSNLNRRHANRSGINIEDEYDVQDIFRSLLFIFFDDIRTEEWNPSYAGSSKRSDFLLKDEQIIIEVKKTRANLKDKEVGEQLIIDIANYKNNNDCKTIYCFVYDPDRYISNSKALEKDLSKDKNIEVIVKVVT